MDILVPASSVSRRNLAQILQQMWRQVGIKTTVTSVDFPVFQQRLRTGSFDSYIGAQLDEPSPANLADQWTSAGIGMLNYSHYSNRVFDSLFRRAKSFRGNGVQLRQVWQEALDTLNWDLPALWLYNPASVAGLARRVTRIAIDPYSWLAALPTWRLSP
jgi:ABC-type transport system substrate-binding protein